MLYYSILLSLDLILSIKKDVFNLSGTSRHEVRFTSITLHDIASNISTEF